MPNEKSRQIQDFIVSNVEEHPSDIAGFAAEAFGISRQAVHNHIKELCHNGVISHNNEATSARAYALCNNEYDYSYQTADGISEDAVWRRDIAQHVSGFPQNIIGIWSYAFTEIFNNAIEHSSASSIFVSISQNALSTTMAIADDGVGIFKHIKEKLNLEDEREAVVELTKGKLTTDPARHSGEGIFFTSRMVDRFAILSGKIGLAHLFGKKEDWIFEDDKNQDSSFSSSVQMKLDNNTSRTSKDVFDKYTTDEDYGFNNTVVPVKLAQYDSTQLVSRSQAKRLLSRLESFKSVILDFNDIETIGQAFADEIFRVFAFEHQHIELSAINTSKGVQNMINRALSALASMK